jgi:polar amino acid transport system substrate-binding protein
MKNNRLISLFVLLAMVLAACSNAATTVAPTTAAFNALPTAVPPTATTAPTDTAVPTATVVPTATATAAPTAVAQVPPGSLAQKGKLLICTDFPYPPQEFFDDNGNPQGMDIDIGTEIANRLGLQVEFVNSVFDSIVLAVSGGKCDIIISAMNVTPDRQIKLSMIPYFQAGQSFVAQKGNPQNINTALDLCGKSAAAESGTTEAAYLAGEDPYVGKGLVDQCKAAGKKPVDVVVTQKDTDALQQLSSGKVAVYSTDTPVAGYYVTQHPDQFQLVGQVIDSVAEGINMPCGVADCTNAPLSPVGQAVDAAFKSMQADGTYLKILTKWGQADFAVKP